MFSYPASPAKAGVQWHRAMLVSDDGDHAAARAWAPAFAGEVR